MYIVLEYFTDLKDNSYAYNVGDTYPRKGYTPTPERIEELSSDKNVRKHAIIEAVTVATVAAENTAEETSEEILEEKPKKRGKRDK